MAYSCPDQTMAVPIPGRPFHFKHQPKEQCHGTETEGGRVMSYRERLLREARKAIGECPQRREEIVGLLELAVSEIEDGGSPAHEYELFINSVTEIQLARGA